MRLGVISCVAYVLFRGVFMSAHIIIIQQEEMAFSSFSCRTFKKRQNSECGCEVRPKNVQLE